MAYTTAALVKTYLGITTATDDTLITALIVRAQKWIDQYTGRTFEAAADATHYFTVGENTQGRDLWLDADLCSITTIKTNADASSPTTLTTADYVTVPRNSAPYHIIRLKRSSDDDWTYDSDPTGGIEVTGKWAYSTTAPDDIIHACIRLTGFLYRQKDSQVFDVTAQPDMGVITVPQGMPADVKIILDPYRVHL